jgi:hypothetical protein
VDDFTPDRTDPRLQRALRERLNVPRGDCPDPEQIAAWSDGAFAPAAAAALEGHLADCSRCQALLASLAATGDLQPAVAAGGASTGTGTVIPLTPRRTMKWALPLAAGLAAMLVLWTMTRDVVGDPTVAPASAPAAESTQALGGSIPPPASAPPAPFFSPSAQQGQAGSQLAERRPAERDVAKAAANQSRERAESARRQGQGALAMPAPPPPPAPVLTPAPTARPDPRASTVTGLPQSTINITGDGALARAGVRQDAIETVTLADAKPIAQFASGALSLDAVAEVVAGNAAARVAGGAVGGTAGRAGGGRGGGGGRGSGAATQVSAPAPAMAKAEAVNQPAHWRIFVGNRVERSRDNGLTWTAIKVDAGLPSITNGSAPSGQICWLVGARGLVLVSADATTFTRAAAPAEVDLVSVQAADERSAVVTAADGRTFTTIDGGKTWK